MLYRLRDIVLAVLMLVCFSWLLVLLILLLALTQKRVFFVQERTGFRGQPFRMVKFSTLRDIGPGETEEGPQRSRLTPLGGLLRRLSLDELPQLWHVLRGQMSLVGPRPLLHEYWDLYTDEEKRRFETLPGITGWAQVQGRNEIPFKEKFKYDLWYVEHKTMALDFRIMGLTLIQGVRGKGVYTDEEHTATKFDGTN